MDLVVDTSVIIAVITNEKHKKKLIRVSKGADLIAPQSLHWEVGNAFSAMFKRRRISLEKAQEALLSYNQIPIRFLDVSLDRALELASSLELYAYDAYFIECARKYKAPLLTLDTGLLEAAKRSGIQPLEV